MLEINKIYCGDNSEILKQIDNESINCCITSPPYWALRDYGVEGQLGLDPTFKEYINKLCNIFDEVKRILRKDGTCWVVIGDSYNNSSWQKDDYKNKFDKKIYNLNKMECGRGGQRNYPDKCLAMIPFRFAIEMVNHGWILRNTIIWYKPNCMPSSAKDRFTVDFEYVFFFVKNKKYWFEQLFDEYTEPLDRWGGDKLKAIGCSTWDKGTGQTTYRNRDMRPNKNGRNKRTVWKVPYSIQSRTKDYIDYRILPSLRDIKDYLNRWRKVAGFTIDEVEKQLNSQAPHHWFNGESYPTREDWLQIKALFNFDDKYDNAMITEYQKSSEKQNYPQGRNKRCVWQIKTAQFPEAHFAVYPEELIEPMIKAGCPESGIVLDPFMGSGTTGVVSKKLGRNFIGIEINPDYVDIANKRLANTYRQMELIE